MPPAVQRQKGQLVRAALAALLLWLAPAWAAPPPTEYQLKAVYLFNFGQFVEWPAHAYESPTAPFAICIAGQNPFGNALNEVISGESVKGRAFTLKRVDDPARIDHCHILFIGRNDAGLLAPTLKAWRGRSVLTVSDIEGAERQGVVIALVNDRNRVRMRINLAAARANDLVISSKLLRPAEIVGHEGD
jgi:hypothetical protein